MQELFVIENESAVDMEIFEEPLGAVHVVPPSYQVRVSQSEGAKAPALRMSISEEGLMVVDIWPDDGELRFGPVEPAEETL